MIYVYDALCGWCYGFSNTIIQFAENHPSEFNTTVMSGGMVVGDRVGPIGKTAPYIKTAYKDVEERTGVTFGEPFLQDVLHEGKTVFDSIPPSIAMTLFKARSKDHHIEFAADLQKGVYFEGKAPTDIRWYADVAAKYGLDKEAFLEDMKHPEWRDKTVEEFKQVQQWGIDGFPMVVLFGNNKAVALAKGASTMEAMETAYVAGIKYLEGEEA